MITLELLTKLREGRCTPGEVAALRTYFDQADQPELDRLLTDDWQATDSASPDLRQLSVAEAQMRVWQRLLESAQPDSTPVRPLNSRSGRPWQWAVTASVAGLLMVGAIWWAKQGGQSTTEQVEEQRRSRPDTAGWVSQRNTTGQPVTLMLSDGSTVTLRPQSQLRYPAQFADSLRTVQLSGEGFFVVQPDRMNPFVVQTSTLLVRVLGTSFTVRAVRGQTVAEVAVRTGRVSVSPTNGKNGITLIPNERATLSMTGGRLEKSLVEQPEVVNPQAVVNRFDFADTPVADVFGVLERAYGVTIQHDRQTLVNCTLTARLSEQPLFTKLDMICASIGASYRIEGTTVIVQSAGCE